MATAEELLTKLQEIDDSHKDDKKSFIDPLNSERDKQVFYEKSQYVNQFLLPKDMEDREELLELCQINYQQLENAAADHLTIFRPQLKDAWQNLAKRIVKKIKRYGELNNDTINYANGCGFDPGSDNLNTVDIKEVQGAGVPKSMGDIKAGLGILKDAAKDAQKAIKEQGSNPTEMPNINLPPSPEPIKNKTKKIFKTGCLFYLILLGSCIGLITFVSSNSGTCNLDGCNNTASGWQYDYSGSQGGYGQACYKTKNAAEKKWGYCSKHHCMTDKVSGY